VLKKQEIKMTNGKCHEEYLEVVVKEVCLMFITFSIISFYFCHIFWAIRYHRTYDKTKQWIPPFLWKKHSMRFLVRYIIDIVCCRCDCFTYIYNHNWWNPFRKLNYNSIVEYRVFVIFDRTFAQIINLIST